MSKKSDIIDNYKKKIGLNIAKYRKSAVLSQKQLAERVGIAPQTLCCIETGINNPSLNVMILIAHELNIPLAYLTTFDDSIFTVEDKELIFLASESLKELDFDKRQLVFKLIDCFKQNS